MRSSHTILAAALALASLAGSPQLVNSGAEAETMVGRSITLAGRKVRCANADIMVDRELPSEGGAGDTILILNPDLLNKQPETVRLFVFSHECGHISVGDSELKADCFAVERGVREHWLDAKGLKQVCDSFEGMPETATHPSAARRCRNLDQCFATAVAALHDSAPAPAVPEPPVPKRTALAPPKALSAWRCADPLKASAAAQDPIADLIAKDAERANACR
jgi:hypothetical protein